MITGRARYEQRREHIAETAARLFLERGYDNVSTTEVAAAAGVAEKTVFNHFLRKETLVFRRFDEFLEEFGTALRSRDRARPLTDTLLADIRDRLSRETTPDEMIAVARIVEASPTLARRRLELLEDHSRVLERTLSDEFPEGDVGGLFRAVSLALVGVHWAVISERGAALARGKALAVANRDALAAAARAYSLFDLRGIHPSL